MASAPAETDIALRDGSTVHVRPIRPSDADGLTALYEGMSEESRVFRFFSAGTDVRRAARRSAESTDGVGLVASIDGRDHLIGIVEYVRYAPDGAEVAFAVADEYHGHGISTLLLAQLAEVATAEGITTFTASVMSGNHKMINLFRASGFPVEVRAVEGEVEVTFPTALDSAGRRRFHERERRSAVAAVGHVLRPASLALIGADTPLGRAARHSLELAGYRGTIHTVAPDADPPLGTELAVVAVPAAELTRVARACARAEVDALLVLSTGIGGNAPAARAARAELLAICRDAGMRLVGPGSLGVSNCDPEVALDVTTAPEAPPAGRIAFATQSSALGVVALDLAAHKHLGLSSFVSLGDKADLSGNDVLQFYDLDPSTDVIALYLESFGNPRKFGRITREITPSKPVLVVKGGRPAAREPLQSHTGVLAAEAGVAALFESAGVIRTETLDELLDTAALLTRQPLPAGDRVAILANARGPGVVCADACVAAGLRLAELSAATLRELPAPDPDNPVDLTSRATAADYGRAARLALDDPGVDAVIAVFVPRLAGSPAEVLDALHAATAGRTDTPLVPVVLGPGSPTADERLPLHGGLEEAARSVGHAVRYARHRDAPPDPLPELPHIDADRASDLIARELARGGDWLPPPATGELLGCYGIRRAPSRWATSPRGVRRAAAELGGRVAVKAFVPGLLHKTEAGAVGLDLSATGAERAARAMARRLHVEGFLVQAMAGPGPELLVGAVGDPSFGPLVLVGSGGQTAELVRDVQVRLAPVGPQTAGGMVRALRTHPLLEGYRGAPGGDAGAVAELVVRVGALAAAHPEIAELDCNPVIATREGAVVVDARLRLGPPPPRRPAGALDR
jgi:acyl-CoA synthetase (NDP forming)/RimJ/RimL family protein N-acetyltransferase